ncbi:recombinase RecT [Rahnella bonaserana]|uniref:recombinase RecT n=1 Tax=Rahnella bonaserana TaxID=2816248 RepID=UPI00320907C0
MSLSIVEFVKSQENLFVGSLADNSVTWGKECQFAIQAFQKNDFLAKTALANPTSAQNAIINVAAIGISLNPASKLAYLVPRDNSVCLDVSYMGLMHIAQASGCIQWGQAKVVYENDSYESNGIDTAPTHKYNAFGERGQAVGVYCTVKTAGGDYLTDEMSVSDIEAIRKLSKAGTSKQGPWVNFWEEMAKKTVVKRASKYWPKAERLDHAIQVVNDEEGIFIEPVMAHTPEEIVQEQEAQRKEELFKKVSTLCDEMESAEDFPSLKAIFAEAYKLTTGMQLQKDVQQIYAERKSAIEGAK